ncbi:response regulator [Rhodococcus ruber]|uniref:Response regulator n=1 Tax=Rhodococcus ruber TaxID=1830 RepID=A0ABT4MHI0_9NOCA|nr:response regulator [Rhodococcus ruber]MCZ4520448.1 response regulator [Rhodococcus ruber]
MTSFGLRCLIVDDSDAYCVAASRLLESAGIVVVGTASTLPDAIRAAQSTHPSLVLVDIDLGTDNGFDVVEALDSLVFTPKPAIILVSTHDEDDFVDLVEMSSAVGFLSKFELSAAAIDTMLSR